jgi:glycerol 2-dehydrogenase (NADP+)
LLSSCPQLELVDFCQEKGILVTAYSPLGSDGSPLQKNPVVVKLAEKHGVQPANILVSLQANRPNVVVIPKSVTPERIASKYLIVTTDLSNQTDPLFARQHQAC